MNISRILLITIAISLMGTVDSFASPSVGLAPGKELNYMLRIYGSLGVGENGYADVTSDRHIAGGAQLFLVEGYTIAYFAFGLDLGYTRFAESSTPDGQIDSSYLNSLLMFELHFLFANLQFGFGPAFAHGEATESATALSFGAGLNLMSVSGMGLSLMYRMNWVFDLKTARSKAVLLGVNFEIP